MYRVLTALFAALASAATLWAAPPKLEVPADLTPVSGYVKFLPDTDAKAVTYVSLDEAYPLPSDVLKDGRMFLLPVSGLKAGSYRFVAVGSLNDEHVTKPFTVKIGGGGTVPIKDPPKDPVPDPTAKLHLMIVRPAGVGVPAAVQTALALKGWEEVGAAGHTFGHQPLDALPADAQAKLGGLPLPLVTYWSYDRPGHVVLTDRPARPLPTTDAAVRELLK